MPCHHASRRFELPPNHSAWRHYQEIHATGVKPVLSLRGAIATRFNQVRVACGDRMARDFIWTLVVRTPADVVCVREGVYLVFFLASEAIP